MSLRVAVVMDYQNIHLSARDVFTPYGTPAHETLVHPLLVAEEVVGRWNADGPPADLRHVQVYRGAPSNNRQKRLYQAAQRQRSEWTRDRRVEVVYRTLRYSSKAGVPPREKGIDVMVALNLVKMAASGEYDVVVLASHDTDLEPALEMASSDGAATIATAGWQGCKRLQVKGRRFRHLPLDSAAFLRTRDRRPYFG